MQEGGDYVFGLTLEEAKKFILADLNIQNLNNDGVQGLISGSFLW